MLSSDDTVKLSEATRLSKAATRAEFNGQPIQADQLRREAARLRDEVWRSAK